VERTSLLQYSAQYYVYIASVRTAGSSDSEARTHTGRQWAGLAERPVAGLCRRAMRGGVRSRRRAAVPAGCGRCRVRRFGEEQALNTWCVQYGEDEAESGMLYPASAPLSLCALFFLELLSVILSHPQQAEPSFCSWSPTSPYLPFRRMAQPSTVLELRRAWPCLIVGGIGCTVAAPAPGGAKLSELQKRRCMTSPSNERLVQSRSAYRLSARRQ
jgi:hypothetical protein